jgi:phenylacetate-CoA ligase
MNWYKKLGRKILLKLLASATPEGLLRKSEQKVLQAFNYTAKSSVAYQTLLSEAGINAGQIQSIDDFHALCPILGKENTFARFDIHELCSGEKLNTVANVLTSSGAGGHFAFGLSSHKQMQQLPDAIDLGLQLAFDVDSKKTLLINCLPMGVTFPSNAVTLAQTSVREDMAHAIATKIGPYYRQVIFIGDPLFLKLLTDYAREKNSGWSKQTIHVVIGEEIFGENYRSYLAKQFCLNLDDDKGGFIGSSMGVGELGLNLFYETRETVKLRRGAHSNTEQSKQLFNLPSTDALPMLFTYNPLATHVEILEADENGYGKLTITLTDKKAILPLLRYQTGDIARLIPLALQTSKNFEQHDFPQLPMIAVKGRDKDTLPNGLHLALYKEALYSDHQAAEQITGAMKIESHKNLITINIQLRKEATVTPELEAVFQKSMPGKPNTNSIKLWPFSAFPFGMSLDYERKFAHLSAKTS